MTIFTLKNMKLSFNDFEFTDDVVFEVQPDAEIEVMGGRSVQYNLPITYANGEFNVTQYANTYGYPEFHMVYSRWQRARLGKHGAY